MGCGASKNPASKYEKTPGKQPTGTSNAKDPKQDFFHKEEKYPHLPPEHKQTLTETFDMLDFDGTGTVDASEYTAATTKKSMKKLFAFMDSSAMNEGDGNGEISLDEWLVGWNRLAANAWTTEQLNDKLIKVQGMRETARLHRARTVFQKMDHANTGIVLRAAYIKRLEADPKLVVFIPKLGAPEGMVAWADVEALLKPAAVAEDADTAE